MYRNNIGCVSALIFILGITSITVLLNLILTKIIIWFTLGVFNHDLSDKFWYIFAAISFILPMLRGIFSVNIRK